MDGHVMCTIRLFGAIDNKIFKMSAGSTNCQEEFEWLERQEQIGTRGIRSTIRSGLLWAASQGLSLKKLFHNNEFPRIQFIYGHHVLDDEVGNFKYVISNLKKEYEFISYSDAVNKILNGSIDKPFISISFDDGLKNCIRIGKILAEYEISACFFICPGVIGNQDSKTLRKFSSRLNLPVSRVLSWEDVNTLQSLGHEIGGHTYSHCNLAEVSQDRMEKEIAKTFDVLKEKVSSPIHFAWPYGRFRHFTERAAELVFETGFDSCASAVRGCHSVVHDGPKSQLCIRRDHFVATRPIRNLRVFLALNALSPWRQKDSWPEQWSVYVDDL